MNSISPATLQLLRFSMLKGVGPVALRKIASIERFEALDHREIASKLPAVQKAFLEDSAWAKALDLAEMQLRQAEAHDARIISAIDTEYPDLLRQTKDDPFILFIKGQFSRASDQSVAIIGTREPTVHGQMITERISKYFAENRWSVVSGLATGCDSIAHSSTLSAGGHTVAVLAHGLHTIYPAKNRLLAEQILYAGGALITEYRFGQDVLPQQFVKRDRTQAGLAKGVVMIQSDIKGGSLYASRAALDYGRWLAVPYPTEKDISNREPKIQSNLLIANGDEFSIDELLRQEKNKTKKIFIIRTREDYSALISDSTPVSSYPTLNKRSSQENFVLSESKPRSYAKPHYTASVLLFEFFELGNETNELMLRVPIEKPANLPDDLIIEAHSARFATRITTKSTLDAVEVGITITASRPDTLPLTETLKLPSIDHSASNTASHLKINISNVSGQSEKLFLKIYRCTNQ